MKNQRKSFKLNQPLQVSTIKDGVESKSKYVIVNEVLADGIVLKNVSTSEFTQIKAVPKELVDLINQLTGSESQ